MSRWTRNVLPEQFREWPKESVSLDPAKIPAMYASGFAGAYHDPAAREVLYAALPEPDGEKVAYDAGIVGDGAGKLSIPFIYSYRHWPKMWPCPGQTTGDCVSHAGKNAALVLIGVEVATAQPDPDTNQVEGFPEVSAEAEAQGVVACENIYRARGHSGQGASCDQLIRYVTSKGGILLRQNYPDLGIDLTKYDASIGIPGGKGVPESWTIEGAKHQIKGATDAPNHEVVRDFIANGYPMWCCSSLGWSGSRDENGFAQQRGSWGHSWIVMGYDDRKETVSKYGFPLFLYNHDWGKWNSGGRRILGTDVDIPEGSFWADARLLNRCDVTAMSNFKGFKRREFPDWGGKAFGWG